MAGGRFVAAWLLLGAVGAAGTWYGYARAAAAPKQLGLLLLALALLLTPLLALSATRRRRIVLASVGAAVGAAMFGLIFFAAGELALRVIYPQGMSFPGHSGPLVRRFERDIVLNRFDGPSRGPAPAPGATSSGLRVLVQGDSITWGQGVRDEAALYTSRALELLRQYDAQADMAVLARPGREIDGHLEQLRKWAGSLDPDVIVYQWYANDIELDKSGRPSGSTPWSRAFFHTALKQRSYLYFFVDFALSQLVAEKGWYERYLSEHYGAGSPGWNAFEQAFVAWARLARQHSTHVIVLLYPHLELRSGSPAVPAAGADEIRARTLALCKAQGLLCVDLTARLSAFADSRTIMASPYDGHPSSRAHAAIAEALLEIVGPLAGAGS